MVESYIKEIEERLQKIQKENDENINTIINMETSDEYGIGIQLYSYGRLYKAVFNATSYEDAIRKLEALKNSNAFDVDNYYDALIKCQNELIENMKKGNPFENDVQMEICLEIEHNLIMDTILRGV